MLPSTGAISTQSPLPMLRLALRHSGSSASFLTRDIISNSPPSGRIQTGDSASSPWPPKQQHADYWRSHRQADSRSGMFCFSWMGAHVARLGWLAGLLGVNVILSALSRYLETLMQHLGATDYVRGVFKLKQTATVCNCNCPVPHSSRSARPGARPLKRVAYMIPLSFGLSRYTANTVMPLRTVDLGKFKKDTPESYSGAQRQNVREYMPKVVLQFCPVEVQVRPRWRRAALVLVPGAVDGRAVRVLGGGASPEQA